MDTADSEDDDNSDAWDETDVPSNQLTKCLFCTKVFTIVEDALEHATKDHSFDLPALKMRLDMDCYSFIKMINYLRLHPMDVKELMTVQHPLWNDDKFMKPTLEDDPWLMYGKNKLCAFSWFCNIIFFAFSSSILPLRF